MAMPGTDFYMDPEILIKDYEGLVRSLVSKYRNNTLNQEDLYQEGIYGLLEANIHFDPSRETQFSTYAHYWIKKRILQALQNEFSQTSDHSTYNDELEKEHAPEVTDNSRKMNLPDDMPNLERQILQLCYDKRLPIREIAKITKMRPERIKQIRAKALRRLRLHFDRDESIS
nr:hypothetical protein [Candidatus Cloacimonadota bacterium]